MSDMDQMGLINDASSRVNLTRSYLANLIQNARRCIYKLGYVLTSTKIEAVLQPLSLVPTIVCLQWNTRDLLLIRC